jgi:hypothetical protein
MNSLAINKPRRTCLTSHMWKYESPEGTTSYHKTLPDLADVLCITLSGLKSRRRNDKWKGIITSMDVDHSLLPVSGGKHDNKMKFDVHNDFSDGDSQDSYYSSIATNPDEYPFLVDAKRLKMKELYHLPVNIDKRRRDALELQGVRRVAEELDNEYRVKHDQHTDQIDSLEARLEEMEEENQYLSAIVEVMKQDHSDVFDAINGLININNAKDQPS